MYCCNYCIVFNIFCNYCSVFNVLLYYDVMDSTAVGLHIVSIISVHSVQHYKAENVTSGNLRLDGGINNICFDKPGGYYQTS